MWHTHSRVFAYACEEVIKGTWLFRSGTRIGASEYFDVHLGRCSQLEIAVDWKVTGVFIRTKTVDR